MEDVPFSNMENGNKQSLSIILIDDILQKDLNQFFCQSSWFNRFPFACHLFVFICCVSRELTITVLYPFQGVSYIDKSFQIRELSKKRSLHTEIFPFLSTTGIPKSVIVLVEHHTLIHCTDTISFEAVITSKRRISVSGVIPRAFPFTYRLICITGSNL